MRQCSALVLIAWLGVIGGGAWGQDEEPSEEIPQALVSELVAAAPEAWAGVLEKFQDQGVSADSLGVGMANAAIDFKARGDYSAAIELNERVLSRFEDSWGFESSRVLAVKNNLAEVLREHGDLQRARSILEELLSAQEALLSSDHPSVLAIKNNLAVTRFVQGDLAGASALTKQLAAAVEDLLGAEDLTTLTVKNNLAQMLQAQGDLSGARALEEAILPALKRVLGPGHADTLALMNNLATTLFVQGDLSGAQALRLEVLSAQERVLGSDHPDTLISKNNLALGLKTRGDLSEALALQEEVLSARERVLGPDHLDTLSSKFNLVGTLVAHGDLSAARALQESVLASREDILGALHIDTLESRYSLALIRYLLGELAEVREECESILETTSHVLGPDRAPDTDFEAQVLSLLASIYRDLGETQQATRTWLETLDVLERQVHRSGDVEELRSFFGKQYDELYLDSLSFLLAEDCADTAFWVVQRYRARSLLRRLDRRHVASGDISSELASNRGMLARDYDRAIQALYTESDDEKRRNIRDDLKRTRREQQKVEAAIRASIPGGDPTVDVAGVEAARAALDPGTLLISYVVGKEATIVFTLSPQSGLEVHRQEIERSELEQLVSRFVAQLGNGPQRHQIVGSVNHKLAKLLTGPIAERIDAAERLIVVADGPLYHLPFAALVRPGPAGNPQFLIEHKPIHIAASASVYRRIQRSRLRTGQPAEDGRLALAAFGEPDYPESLAKPAFAGTPPAEGDLPGSTRRAIRGAIGRDVFTGFKPLPYSGREVRAIGSIYEVIGSTVARTGADASEANLKCEAPRARVVHIAAHGFFDPIRPLDSFVALSLSTKPSDLEITACAAATAPSESPPAGEDGDQRTENGLLQAWELFDGGLRLNADLVVLSACETALGEDRGGEGIVSLTRAFQVAGARSIVASLWAVADDSTAELMIRFHRYLRDGLTKDVALQQAQIDFIRGRLGSDGEEVKEGYSAPYHWAAFQLFGDWQ